MNFDDRAALANVAAVLRSWPIGTVVWHRGSGDRGVIDGVRLCADATAIPSVAYGGRCDFCFPIELSRTPVRDPESWESADSPP